MQIYLKPYPHNTYTNVPYAPVKGTQNAGYFDIKKFPGKAMQIPELKNEPLMVEWIQKINKESRLSTFGCDIGAETYQAVHTKWSFINIFLTDLDDNLTEQDYYMMISDFIKQYSDEPSDNIVVEFIINPTNFHDFDRFKKGVRPNEETVLFRGYSLNCKIMGAGDSLDSATELWHTGLNMVGNYLSLEV